MKTIRSLGMGKCAAIKPNMTKKDTHALTKKHSLIVLGFQNPKMTQQKHTKTIPANQKDRRSQTPCIGAPEIWCQDFVCVFFCFMSFLDFPSPSFCNLWCIFIDLESFYSPCGGLDLQI